MISNCLPCTAGEYCGTPGLSAVTGPCAAGYYCSNGALSPLQPAVTSIGGPCSIGHYCLEGSGTPTRCPVGTSMSVTGATGNVTYQV
jgi:hypothetical protein